VIWIQSRFKLYCLQSRRLRGSLNAGKWPRLTGVQSRRPPVAELSIDARNDKKSKMQGLDCCQEPFRDFKPRIMTCLRGNILYASATSTANGGKENGNLDHRSSFFRANEILACTLHAICITNSHVHSCLNEASERLSGNRTEQQLNLVMKFYEIISHNVPQFLDLHKVMAFCTMW
jgi:hypothetical protein